LPNLIDLPALPELVSTAKAASLLNVGARTVEAARAVRDHAIPELTAKGERDEVRVSTAANIAKLPQPGTPD
jgi:hypothetical protein